ncbi:unnamed protein product [Xylocopa violacea]|uniref:PiggyBac transposable element-derived protein domain-containing protein n=1 Tax=Xylocopa violacea TaxID=135666 RepID=A0ABP1MW95_XYLVO
MIEHVRKYSELEAFRVLETKWNLSIAKLYAFIGLLYARGAYEAKNMDPSFFSTTMSRNDFTEISRFIRFDNKNQRSERLQNDKFALISEVWCKFIENSQNCYKPGAYLSIDEQLFPTKARCRFTQYMPNKPDKFGIKFWLVSDVSSKYIVNGFPHLGKDEGRESSVPLGEFVTLKLAKPYTGHGRNITTDNFFTSVSLATLARSLLHFSMNNFRENLLLDLVGVFVQQQNVDDHHITTLHPRHKHKDYAVCSNRKVPGGRKETSYICETYDRKPGLHIGECFKRYHTMLLIINCKQ